MPTFDVPIFTAHIEELVGELGHKMGFTHDGKMYCLNKSCAASLSISGQLPTLYIYGSAFRKECPVAEVRTR